MNGIDRALSVALALACALIVTDPGLASATPPDTNGFGSRAVALGGALSADVEDGSSPYYNPAGLVRAGNLRLGVGYLSTENRLSINGVDSDVERISGLNVTIVAPATFGQFRFAFGLALHLPDQRLSRTRSSLVDRPRWELYDTRPHKVYMTTSLGIRVVEWLTLGAGITFQSPTELSLNIRGTADLLDAERDSRLEHEFKGDLVSIRYPSAGLQIIPNDWLSFGLTYRASFELKNTIRAGVDGDLTGLGEIPIDFGLVSTSVSTFGPQQLVLGVAYEPTDRLRLGFDLTWIDWSAHTSLIPDEMITLDIDVPDGINIDVPEEIVGREPIPMELEDRWVPRLGVEYTAIRNDAHVVDLRFGYVYENTPFPTQQAVTNFVDSTRHQVSVGIGWTLTDLEPTLPGSMRVDAHFVYSYLPDRDHQKASIVDPVGDFTAGGYQLGAGLNIEVAFE